MPVRLLSVCFCLYVRILSFHLLGPAASALVTVHAQDDDDADMDMTGASSELGCQMNVMAMALTIGFSSFGGNVTVCPDGLQETIVRQWQAVS